MFSLFLFYSTIENLFLVIVFATKLFVNIVTSEKFTISRLNMSMFITLGFSFVFLLISGISFLRQIHLIMYNLTPIEKQLYYYDIRESIFYSPERYENLSVIFGSKSYFEWFFPNFIENE